MKPIQESHIYQEIHQQPLGGKGRIFLILQQVSYGERELIHCRFFGHVRVIRVAGHDVRQQLNPLADGCELSEGTKKESFSGLLVPTFCRIPGYRVHDPMNRVDIPECIFQEEAHVGVSWGDSREGVPRTRLLAERGRRSSAQSLRQ